MNLATILMRLLKILKNQNKMKLKHFKKSEFTCKCGCGETVISDELLQMLDDARKHAGVPFKITSGYRCPNHPESKKKIFRWVTKFYYIGNLKLKIDLVISISN